MANLPELQAHLKPFTADELKREERRCQRGLRLAAIRKHYAAIGDDLIKFKLVV